MISILLVLILLSSGAPAAAPGSDNKSSSSSSTTRSTTKTPPQAKKATVTAKAGSAKTNSSRRKSSRKRTPPRRRGQLKPDGERTREIQEKLISAGAMTGTPNEVWDSRRMEEAIRKFQSMNGINTTGKLDVKTLKALGLKS
jgi:peptidoglycan hydrolase-like protein with peptidoglycan-binding domain